MGKYDVAVCHYLSDNERFAELFNASEFGGKPVLAAEDKLHPVHTMCFYHGTEPWNGPRSLKDMMDFQGALPEWQNHFHDYQMSLFCADEVKDLSYFKTGLKQFLEVSALRKNRKELVELWEREEYRHLDRATAEVIAVITDANDVLEQLDRYEKDGEYDMCQAMDEWKEELLGRGMENGIMRSIQRIMQTLEFTVDQAMDALQIPEDERALYKSKI